METMARCPKCKLKLHNRRKCPICKVPVIFDYKKYKEPLRHATDTPLTLDGWSGYDLVTELEADCISRRRRY